MQTQRTLQHNTLRQMGLAFMILAWLLPVLACNMPVGPRRPGEISVAEIRQTLAAQSLSTQSPLQETLPSDSTSSSAIPSSTPGLPQTLVAQPFPATGLRTATPGEPQPVLPQPTDQVASPPYFAYLAQSGDTLIALATRFQVNPEQITSPEPIPSATLIRPGQLFDIPNLIGETAYPSAVLPDSEVTYSPSSIDFQISDYIKNAGGFLSTYTENVAGELLSGAEIIQRVAEETSTNPRFLLSFLEFRSHWVLGQPQDPGQVDYPIGLFVPGRKGLYHELSLSCNQLLIGYYGWRESTLSQLKFREGGSVQIDPQLNAGSVAVQYLFARLYRANTWAAALYGPQGFLAIHQQMFGDPWARAAQVEPIFTPEVSQPTLELPFSPGERWSLTGGPHRTWNSGSALGAVDFSPVTGEAACTVSRAWVTASAAGLVTRSGANTVILDLDRDGYEQTGWVVFYFHIADADRVLIGTRVNTGDRLGHPSCEGGNTTGTDVHIARKYDGEWITADGPLPFVLSNWLVHAGPKIYAGTMTKDDQEVTANPGGSRTSIIVR